MIVIVCDSKWSLGREVISLCTAFLILQLVISIFIVYAPLIRCSFCGGNVHDSKWQFCTELVSSVGGRSAWLGLFWGRQSCGARILTDRFWHCQVFPNSLLMQGGEMGGEKVRRPQETFFLLCAIISGELQEHESECVFYILFL